MAKYCKGLKYWQGLCKSIRPKSKSYETLVGHHLDKAIPVKMKFFQDVASQLKVFCSYFKSTIIWFPFLNMVL